MVQNCFISCFAKEISNNILQFGNQGGILYLYDLMRKFIDLLRKGGLRGREEEDTALLLYDSVKCLKSIVNTWVCSVSSASIDIWTVVRVGVVCWPVPT